MATLITWHIDKHGDEWHVSSQDEGSIIKTPCLITKDKRDVAIHLLIYHSHTHFLKLAAGKYDEIYRDAELLMPHIPDHGILEEREGDKSRLGLQEVSLTDRTKRG